jgi:hypothetical protein
MVRRRRHKAFWAAMETDSRVATGPGFKLKAYFLLMFVV